MVIGANRRRTITIRKFKFAIATLLAGSVLLLVWLAAGRRPSRDEGRPPAEGIPAWEDEGGQNQMGHLGTEG